MTDTSIAATVAAVIAAATAVVLVLVSIRRRRFTLAHTGLLLVLCAIPVALVQPATGIWDGVLNAIGYALVFACYPGGAIRPRWLWAPLAVAVAGAVGLAVVGLPALTQGWYAAVPLAVTVLIGATIVRYLRRLSTGERESVRWAVLGVIVTFGGMSAVITSAALSGTTIADAGFWLNGLTTILILFFPLALTVGLVAPGVAPVDVALFHTVRMLVVAVPIALAAGLLIGVSPGSPWLAAIVAGVGAVPLWFAGGRVAAWFVYRGRMSPPAAVLALEAALGSADDAAAAPHLVADLVGRALGTSHVVVSGAGLRTGIRSEGSSDAAPVVRREAVLYAGSAVAEIAVAARRGETTLTRTDRGILTRLARHAAPALHAAAAVTEVLEARAALVHAHEEERKRLRRDLHDELAPTLVGLRLTASGLVRLLDGDTPELADAARTMVSDVETAIGQTRALAYGLRPPVLDDGGLVSAIRDRARSSDDLAVTVAAPSEPLEIPAAVEVAALRIVQEAVTNVRRHADAHRCDVVVSVDDHTLRVHVDDDGKGIVDAAGTGLGLASMRARVDELGGRFSMETSPLGGVRIDAALPVGTP